MRSKRIEGKPWLLKFFSFEDLTEERKSREKEKGSFHEGRIQFSDEKGLKQIILREELPTIRRGEVLRHELGHLKFDFRNIGVADPFLEPEGEDEDLTEYTREERLAYWQQLAEELVASYFALKGFPKSKDIRRNIYFLKSEALSRGYSPKQVSLLESKATSLVGYQGRPVKRLVKESYE